MTTPTTQELLYEATAKWLNSLLNSASSDVIGVSNFWPRATSALQTAATAETYGQAVTIACNKLQIDSTQADTATELHALEKTIGANFLEWKELVSVESVYLIVLTRIERNANRTKRAAKKAADRAVTKAEESGANDFNWNPETGEIEA